MNWLKNEKGNIINLDTVTSIFVDYDYEGIHVCCVNTKGSLIRIKSKLGTEAAALGYIDTLLAQLNEEVIMID